MQPLRSTLPHLASPHLLYLIYFTHLTALHVLRHLRYRYYWRSTSMGLAPCGEESSLVILLPPLIPLSTLQPLP